MKLNYIFKNEDDQIRANCLLHALFETQNKSIEDYLGETTVTISDQSPCFYLFDTQLTRHGNIGWRIAAKNMGEKFFGEKPDVRKVTELVEKYYSEYKEKLIEETKEIGAKIVIGEIPEYPKRFTEKTL